MSAGFYNNLVWPETGELARRRHISEDLATELLDRALRLHVARQDYARALRTWLDRHHLPGLDTPFLVGGSMSRHGEAEVGADLFHWWKIAKDLEDPELPERDSYPVRVCSYKVDAATSWALDGSRRGHGGIIWYYHQAMGVWLTEALQGVFEADRILHAPAGADTAILENAGKFVVASIKAHGVGKNLQHHHYEQLFVQWPRGADTAEQAIGRTHRMGQERDEVVIHTVNTLPWDHDNFAATLNDSLYIHQTAQEQKLIQAAYDPIPKVMPWEVLKERGFQPQELSPEMRALMGEKFDVDTKEDRKP